MVYTPQQQAENRAKWIEALESGNYKQSREALRAEGGFCCLGVACDVLIPDGWERIYDELFRLLKEEERHLAVWTIDNGGMSFLPASAINMLGLSSNNGTFLLTKDVFDRLSQPAKDKITGRFDVGYLLHDEKSCIDMDLIDLNDALRFSFKEIAEIIRLEPPGLLVDNPAAV